MADIHDLINDLCYIISVAALLGILIFIILGNINISPQIIGSTLAAFITLTGAVVTIHYKDWGDNRIDIEVMIREYAEEEIEGDISGYLVASARNKSSKRTTTIDSFRLRLYEDGRERKINVNWKKDERNKNIAFPYDLLPGKKLSITLNGSNDFREYFLDHETGVYNFPRDGCLIAYFEDQVENIWSNREPFRIC